MIDEKAIEELEKEGYRIVGEHSAVKICKWTKKAIRGEDVCWKEKFYGIESHKCCQCLHLFCVRINVFIAGGQLNLIRECKPKV